MPAAVGPWLRMAQPPRGYEWGSARVMWAAWRRGAPEHGAAAGWWDATRRWRAAQWKGRTARWSC